MTLDRHWDAIVVGSGPGGAAAAQRIAAAGRSVLLIEQGGYLPREEANWDARAVFVDGRYEAGETWEDAEGEPFKPSLHHFVGGNSKVYGAALLRMRERDFEETRHPGGLSPAWPLRYDAFEPYYAQAERLFSVHGLRGEDPAEPPSSGGFLYPPVAHDPQVEALADALRRAGAAPFHLPLGVLLDERDGVPTPTSPCIRCRKFDGFPCPLNAKADAQIACVVPMLASARNATLLTKTRVTRLETDTAGTRVAAVVAERGGAEHRFRGDLVVVACGALSSALLLLRSANHRHPDGLANASGLVGRNYMRHEMSIALALSRETNGAQFGKTLALSDWYWGDGTDDTPLGLIQLTAALHPEQIAAEALPAWLKWKPGAPFALLASHATGFWLQSEDVPHPENRIRLHDGRVRLELVRRNREAVERLEAKLADLLTRAGWTGPLLSREVPLATTSHQAGTMRFGVDPASSVLNTDCRAHGFDNLYVTDSSCFPSVGAVNPTLTIVANALRVADGIVARLDGRGADVAREMAA